MQGGVGGLRVGGIGTEQEQPMQIFRPHSKKIKRKEKI